jgi:hypothetical protein
MPKIRGEVDPSGSLDKNIMLSEIKNQLCLIFFVIGN